ncbi:MAG: hypothetical protein WC505_04595 [Patescibacteria group bacterium]
MPKESASNKDTELQKRLLAVFIVVTVIVVGLGVWNLSNQLSQPFDFLRSSSNSSSNAGTNTDVSSETADLPVLEGLKDKDTDSDGLVDYDEFYLYKTSPYIADSDSDQLSDKIEIDQGTNPNCPEGEDACSTTFDGAQVSTDGSEIFPELAADAGVDVSNFTADELRIMLADMGVSQDALSTFSDEEILDIYQETLADSGTGASSEDAPSNEETTDYLEITYNDLLNLEPDEIRELLVEYGVPRATLDELDDETLKAVYLQSLLQNSDTADAAEAE